MDPQMKTAQKVDSADFEGRELSNFRPHKIVFAISLRVIRT